MDAGKKFILLGLVLAGLMISCAKDPQDIPPGIAQDPVFRMSGTFGNETIDIAAGSAGWTDLPFVTGEDSFPVYSSVFSQDACLDQCTPSWTFRFYNSLPVDGDPGISFSNTIKEGEKELVPADSQLDSFAVSIATHPSLFMSGYSLWEDLNASSTSFYHEYQTTVGYQEAIHVCFQTLAFTGCQYMQCIYFDPVTQVPCLASIEPILENPRYLSLNVKPEGTPPFQISWFNESASSSIVIPIDEGTSEIYAGVTVTDAKGNKTELHQTIRLQDGYVDACYFPVSLTTSLVENNSPYLQADKVEIIYVDPDGVEWRTTSGVQINNGQIAIDKVSEYGLSPAGEPAYRIDLSVNVMLFNVLTGESKELIANNTSIALSHP